MKQKKDMIFIVVLGLALANLIYWFAAVVTELVKTHNLWFIVLTFADGIAIVGILYLLRSYKRARTQTKKLEIQEKENKDIENK